MPTAPALDVGLDAGLFGGGSATVTTVPARFDVALNGRAYLVDSKPEFYRYKYVRNTVPLLRTQADTGNLPGEQSINPAGLWPRAAESWHHGAGQAHFDRPDSDSSQFRTSKGVNVWARWQLTLLGDTANRKTSANTNLAVISVGTRLYVVDGNALSYTTDITAGSPTFTGVTGGPVVAPTSMASDGYNVWVAYGDTNGVYTTNRGSGAATQLVTSTLSGTPVVGYVKGRLMVANGPALYNITSVVPAVLPTALFTQANTDFTWVAFAEGPTNIYAAGYSGDKSLIYRTSIKTDGTALDAPQVAGELPDGEIVRAIQGYLGFLVIGTDKGLRLANIGSTGDLTIGALVTTSSAVRCFEPQDRFVWYGLTNYDAVSTGLGRLDLTVFTQPTTPAYASDLMATAQGAVTSVATFQNLRVFAVSGVGVFAETAALVASGTIDSGHSAYGIPDDKVAMALDLRHDALVGSVAGSLSINGGSFTQVGSTNSAAATTVTPLAINQQRGERFEWRVTLSRSGSVTTTGPTLTRATLRSYPAPARTKTIAVPIMLYEQMKDRFGNAIRYDPHAELDAIDLLWASQQLCTYQEGTTSFSVLVDDYEWRPHQPTSDDQPLEQFWNGTVLVTLRVIQ